MSTPEPEGGEFATAGLVGVVLDAEAERRARTGRGHPRCALRRRRAARCRRRHDVRCRDGIVHGGVFTFVMLALLQSFDELESATLSILAPNIRDSFHVSDGAIVFIAAATGSFLVLGSAADGLARRPVPARADHRLGDRRLLGDGVPERPGRRTRSRCSGPASGSASPRRTRYPVQGSLIADTYPISVRGRIDADDHVASASRRCSVPPSSAGPRRSPAATTGGGGRTSSSRCRRSRSRSSRSASPSRRAVSSKSST